MTRALDRIENAPRLAALARRIECHVDQAIDHGAVEGVAALSAFGHIHAHVVTRCA